MRSCASCGSLVSDAPARPPVAGGPAASLHGDIAEQHHLVLEVDAELLARAAARLCHEREAIGSRGFPRVLDEVGVLRRDHGAAYAMPLQATSLQHGAGTEPAGRVLED